MLSRSPACGERAWSSSLHLGCPKGSGDLCTVALPGAVWPQSHLPRTELWAREQGQSLNWLRPQLQLKSFIYAKIGFCGNWAISSVGLWPLQVQQDFLKGWAREALSLLSSGPVQFLQPWGPIKDKLVSPDDSKSDTIFRKHFQRPPPSLYWTKGRIQLQSPAGQIQWRLSSEGSPYSL